MTAPFAPGPPSFDAAATFNDVLGWRAAHHADRPYLSYLADGERAAVHLSFGELHARVRDVASLVADRAGPGERVLLLFPPGPDFVVGFFACLAAGVVAVPAYPPRNARHLPRIDAILADAGARAILTLADTRHRVGAWLGDRDWPIVCADEAEAGRGRRFEPPPLDRDSVAFLQYTSGSTGQPKGVVVTHGNLLVNERMIRESFGYDETSDFVSWLPIYHDMGLVGNVLQPMFLGSRAILMSPAAFLQKPARWLQAISDHRARTTGAPNFAFDLAARTVTAEQKAALDLGSLDLVYSGSEPIDPRALDRFAEAFAPCGLRREALYPCYGMAETTLLATGGRKLGGARTLGVSPAALGAGRVEAADAEAPGARLIVSCGYPVAGGTIAIVDPDTRARKPDDEVGEIWLSGPHVARGYWGRPELTRETFEARLADGGGPYLRTGDLGFLRGGELYVTGRLKDVVIIRGRNYYPQDIERVAAASHAALVAGGTAAFGIDANGEERLAIVQEVHRTAARDLDAPAIAAAIARAVAEEFELQVFDVALVKPLSVPKTSSGKIQRRACRERRLAGELETIASWRADGRLEDAAPAAAGTPTLARLVEWIRARVAAHLGRAAADVDPRAPFSAYGLDSLTLVRLSGDLAAWIGRELAPTLLYDYPTIDGLARHLTGEEPRRGAAARGGHHHHEPIAIVGIGCRFPGGVRDPESYWRLLAEGVDAIGEAPADRWSAGVAPRWGGFLDDIDRFDPAFFAVSPREAAAMDPQQRLLLEVAWEALEHAGIAPDRLAGTAAGVFVGISTHDYARLQLFSRPERVDMYSGTGNAFSAASGRLSYVLGTHGPSLSIDTACSSSLVAVHLACRSLREGECDAALAAGVNAILAPELSVAFARAGMMAADGRCKTFDASADGYVRSEGCGVVVLKRLSDARADGDRIVAVIRGTAVNQDGRSNGLTAPSGPAQEAVIRQALAAADVARDEIDYVEAHGTGTSLGDPIEVAALAAALGADRTRRLAIGSVKTNVGHLEAAAGIASLIKTALALDRGAIPSSLHFTTPNPYIPWASLPVHVPTTCEVWPATGRPRRAGVSAFGFTGTNAHAILEQAPPAIEAAAVDRPVHVLALSAKDDEALARITRECIALLSDGPERPSLADLCHTANAGRSHFDRRVAGVGATAAEMRASLERARPSVVDPGAPPRVAWLFTGQGSQYIGMGRALFEAQPVFHDALVEADAIVRAVRGESLLEVLFDDAAGAPGARPIDRTYWTQPAIFAIGRGLAELWRSWGIEPAVLVGHSVGEFTAATVAGVFSFEDGLRIVLERARLMQSLPEGGGMLAVFGGEDAAASASAGEPEVAVAATNAPDETVLSGDAAALARVARRLEERGIRSTPLRVSHAFHSPLMAPVAAAFADALGAARLAPPRVPLVSNLTGRLAGGEIATFDYWRRHLTSPVRFRESVATLAAMNLTHGLELGPSPVLSALASRGWTGAAIRWLPSLRPRGDGVAPMLDAVAALYLAGAPIDWAGVDRGLARRRVSLPTYPFRRDRCWVAADTADASGSGRAHPLLGVRLPEVATNAGTIAWQLDRAQLGGALWRDYRIDDVAKPSAAVFTQLAVAAASDALDGAPPRVERIEFTGAGIDVDRLSAVQVAITPFGGADADCRIFARLDGSADWTPLAEARVSTAPARGRVSARKPLDVGVMFFNGSEEKAGRHHYRLVLEAARFADRRGFSSVWAPERHYTAFGGLYPNPSVLHAALARETRHLRLMAGSLVMPLHHPLRAAEDWALVDNLSGGRVGVSLASGWNPDDFAVAPGKFDGRHDDVFRQLETLRTLWRGETIEATSGSGRAIRVRTYPTPIQREFPACVTAAGNPRTFERAGAAGAHLLTHLLDQGVEDLAPKIALYRDARARAGHDPAAGRVTLMLHTFLGEDLETVRELVREPYCEYIQANIGLLKGLAYSRGGDVDIAALSPRDLDEFVGFLYDRFFDTRALLGTPESARALAGRVYDAGVDEIACLIDFGPPTADVLASLPHLARLKDEVRARPAGPAVAPPPSIDLDQVRTRCDQALPADVFYRRLASRGVAFGEGLQTADRFNRTDGEALVRLRRPVVDPALAFDAAMQAFIAALPSSAFVNTSDGLYSPWEAAGFAIDPAAGPVVYAHATLERRDAGARDAFSGSVALLSEDGRIVAKVDRLVAVRDEPARKATSLDQATAGWLYNVTWPSKPLVSAATPLVGRWLVLADAAGVGQALADTLGAEGCVVTLAREADTDALDPAAIRALVERAGGVEGLAGVVHLWTLDAGADATIDRLHDGQRLGVAASVHLVQALAAVASRARLWVVTRGAQSAAADEAPALAQAPVWGFGRVASLEYPQLWGGLVDLDPARPSDRTSTIADARAIARELAAADEEDQVVLRAGRRLAPRLVASPAPARSAVAFDPRATYLVTGGVGGLGRRVAHWMVKHGATDLVLTGRRALPPPASWDDLPEGTDPRVRERVAAVRSLEAQGARVRVFTADASRLDQMRGVFDEIARSGRPLAGIVHLAGIPENQPLADVRFDRDRRILAPKIDGAWIVHELSRHLPLDFFVTFSSISAVWGSRGQPLYAAANHFLDALAAYRRAHGLPVLTVSWGPWSEGGMVDREGLDLLARMGVASLAPDEATFALGRLLGAGAASRVVANVDWRVFKDLFEARHRRPMLDSVEAGDERGGRTPGEATNLRRGLEALAADERRSRLGDYVAREVAAVLGWTAGSVPDARKGFFDMGMDSLTALELKNRLQASLGLTLRATVVFNHSTIGALADYLDALVAPPADATEAAGLGPRGAEPQDLDRLSEDELARLLDREIGAVDSASEG